MSSIGAVVSSQISPPFTLGKATGSYASVQHQSVDTFVPGRVSARGPGKIAGAEANASGGLRLIALAGGKVFAPIAPIDPIQPDAPASPQNAVAVSHPALSAARSNWPPQT